MAESRESLITRVRAALQARRRPSTPRPEIDEALVRLARPDAALATLFTERARAVGIEVERTRSARWPADLADWLSKAGVDRVVSGLERADGLEAALAGAGIALAAWNDLDDPGELFDGVGAGVTGVAAAIAATGSLVLHSSARAGRGVSLVPPIHVAVVRGRDLRADLLDYVREMGAVAPEVQPASRVLVTGPSKTADIEGELVRGVHGPGRVLALLVEDG